jgi:hypothetical protein
MAAAGRANAASTMLEGAGKPWWKGASGTGYELQPGPGSPCQGASHGFEGKDCLKGFGGGKAAIKVTELGSGHALGCKIMLEFLQHDFAGDRRRAGRFAEGRKDIGLCGGRGVVAPEGDKGLAYVFRALDSGPVRQKNSLQIFIKQNL